MRRPGALSLIPLLYLLGASRFADGASTVNLTVNVVIATINELAVGTSSLTINVDTLTGPGAQPSQASASTTYSLSTNDSSQRKITAQVNTTMPAGVTLKVNLAAPGGQGGTSQNDVDISNSAVVYDVVTAINKVGSAGRTLTYKVDAVVAYGTAGLTRIVTLTLTAG